MIGDVMKTLMVINPKAGRCRPEQIEKMTRDYLGNNKLRVCITGYPGHAEDMARNAVLKGFDKIIVVGGDGTINEVLNGIVGSDMKLAIIPAGTANDLAAYHGIPKDIEAALNIIKAGTIRSLCAIKVNRRYYLTIGGVGLAAEVVENVNQMRRKTYVSDRIFGRLGSLIYIFGLISVLINKSPYARNAFIDTKAKVIRNTVSSLLIGQQPRLGKHFNIFPGINGNPGRANLQLITNREKGLAFLVNLLAAIHILKRQSPGIKTTSFSKAVIRFDRPARFFGDGEILDENDRFTIEIIPNAVDLIVSGEKGGRAC